MKNEMSVCKTLIVMIWLIVVTGLGCADVSLNTTAEMKPALSKDEPALDFAQTEFFLSVDRNQKVATTIVPFQLRMKHPVRIKKVHTSCSCTTPGVSFDGKLIEPGVEYKMPVSIDVNNKNGFETSLVFETEIGRSCTVLFKGIQLAAPWTVPAQVSCSFKASEWNRSSGEFEVRRPRRAGTPALRPAVTKLTGEVVEISFGGGTEEVGKWDGNLIEQAAVDVLKWSYRLIGKPLHGSREVIRIPWTEAGEAPTEVTILFEKIPEIRGLVDELDCGELFSGGVWTHSLVLQVGNVKSGRIRTVSSDAAFIKAGTRQGKSIDFVFIEIAVTPPEIAGQFSGAVILTFEDGREFKIQITGISKGKARQ